MGPQDDLPGCASRTDPTGGARRWAWNLHRTLESDRAKWVKATRWALVKDPGHWRDSQRAVMARLKRDRSVLYRAWLLN
jgi:hypothetical protein